MVTVNTEAYRARLSGAIKLRFVGRIPTAWAAETARMHLGEGVSALLQEVQRAVDGGPLPRVGRVYATASKGAQQPNTVCMEVAVSRELEIALRDRLGPKNWVQLQAPWNGLVAVFTGGPGEVREAHVSGFEPTTPLDYAQELLEHGGIPVVEVCSLPSVYVAGTESGDTVHLVVAANTKLPSGLVINGSAGEGLVSLKIRPISNIPPAPGGDNRATYAAAAAAGGTGSGMPLVAAAAGQPAAASRQPGSAAGPRGGTAPSGQRPGSPSGSGPASSRPPGGPHNTGDAGPAGGRRAMSSSPTRRTAAGGNPGGSRRGATPPPRGADGAKLQRQLSPGGGLRGRSRARYNLRRPADNRPTRSLSPGSAAKKQIVATPAGGPAAVPSANPFAQLNDADDMDETPADVAARLAANPEPNGGSAGGS